MLILPEWKRGYTTTPHMRLRCSKMNSSYILLWELYDIVSYQNVTLDERNALNPEACRLLREHEGLLAQLTPKPFLRRAHKLQITVREI